MLLALSSEVWVIIFFWHTWSDLSKQDIVWNPDMFMESSQHDPCSVEIWGSSLGSLPFGCLLTVYIYIHTYIYICGWLHNVNVYIYMKCCDNTSMYTSVHIFNILYIYNALIILFFAITLPLFRRPALCLVWGGGWSEVGGQSFRELGAGSRESWCNGYGRDQQSIESMVLDMLLGDKSMV